jgi:heat-inducible transcriptional repressor
MPGRRTTTRGALTPDVPERLQRLLAALVRSYIERGEPVSSLLLAKESGLTVSSATVRSMLARLEEMGFVRQPHTSAGRVPTDLGYRFYVDMLLQSRRPSRALNELEQRLRRAGSLEETILDNVSHELSRVSQHVGFALAPAADASTLKHVDFVSLDATRVLVIVVAGSSQVTHKLIELQEAVGPSELSQAANYLNAEFAGRPLSEIREAVLQRLQEDRALYDRLLARALHLAGATFEDVGTQAQLFVHGASSLIDAGQDEDVRLPMTTLRALLSMMEEKHRLVQILSEYLDGVGLTVVIGTEHADPHLRNFSLVASTYVDSGRQGVVGVIGPTRMRYSRSIAAVDSASRVVTRVLVGDGPSGDSV